MPIILSNYRLVCDACQEVCRKMKIKASYHNGRRGSPSHNDRKFLEKVQEVPDHIDPDKSQNNLTYSVYGDTTTDFETQERKFYDEYFSHAIELQKEKYIKNRQYKFADKCTAKAKYESKRTCPEESIYQIGNHFNTVPKALMLECYNELFQKQVEWSNSHGNPFTILNFAFHEDEKGAVTDDNNTVHNIHCHERKVWHVKKTDDQGREYFDFGQEKALEQAGIELPEPNKKMGRYNNRKIAFDSMVRQWWEEIITEKIKNLDLELDTVREKRPHLEQAEYEKMRERELRQSLDKLIQEQNEVQDKIRKSQQEYDDLQSNVEKLRQEVITNTKNEMEFYVKTAKEAAQNYTSMAEDSVKKLDKFFIESMNKLNKANSTISELENRAKWCESTKILGATVKEAHYEVSEADFNKLTELARLGYTSQVAIDEIQRQADEKIEKIKKERDNALELAHQEIENKAKLTIMRAQMKAARYNTERLDKLNHIPLDALDFVIDVAEKEIKPRYQQQQDELNRIIAHCTHKILTGRNYKMGKLRGRELYMAIAQNAKNMAKESGIETKEIGIERIKEVVEACHEQIRQKQGHEPSTRLYSAAKGGYVYAYAPQKKTQAWEQPPNTTDYSVPLIAYSQGSFFEMEKDWDMLSDIERDELRMKQMRRELCR